MQLNPSEISELIKAKIENLASGSELRTQGTIVSVTDGIIRIHGLSDVMAGEMIELPGNTFGLALNLERDSVGAVVLGDYEHIKEGDTAKCTGRILEVPVGRELLGRVVNALGQPIDGKGPVSRQVVIADGENRSRRDCASVREPACADRTEIHRLHGADRPRPARADHRRSPDRQDRRGHRCHHQSEGHGR